MFFYVTIEIRLLPKATITTIASRFHSFIHFIINLFYFKGKLTQITIICSAEAFDNHKVFIKNGHLIGEISTEVKLLSDYKQPDDFIH